MEVKELFEALEPHPVLLAAFFDAMTDDVWDELMDCLPDPLDDLSGHQMGGHCHAAQRSEGAVGDKKRAVEAEGRH